MNITAVMSIVKQKIKRHVYIYLFSIRVQKQLELREGKCLQCGRCCKLVFRCPMLEGETPHSRCRIYNHRSKVCMQFPISEEDLMDANYQCGHSFRTADNMLSFNTVKSNSLPYSECSQMPVQNKFMQNGKDILMLNAGDVRNKQRGMAS